MMPKKSIEKITEARIEAIKNNRIMKPNKRMSKTLKREILLNYGIIVS